MSKKTKFSISTIIVMLSVMLGFVAYAEDSTNTTTDGQPVACTMDAKLCPDGSSVGRTGPKCEFICPGEKDSTKGEDIRNKFREIKGELKDNRDSLKEKRDEFKNEVTTVRTELQGKKVELRSQLNQLVGSVKAKREELKAKFEADKEEAKVKITEMRANFKDSLSKIKDENKKLSAEKIVDTILGLNTQITTSLSDKTDKIENVLVSIESRTAKAEDKGLDVSAVKIQTEKAKTAITAARDAISTQSKKVYTLGTITDETTLRVAMRTLRDNFTKDIKDLREKVKLAHAAVRDAATTLAKIPKVDQIDNTIDETTKVEDSNTQSTTNNTNTN